MIVNCSLDVSSTQRPKDQKYLFIEDFDFKGEMDFIFTKVGNLDKFVQINEPFKKIKTDTEGAKRDLKYAVQELSDIALRLQPVMPETSEKIQNLIQQNKKPETPLFLRKE